MSATADLLASLRERGVEVALEGGDLRVRAPRGVLAVAEIDALRAQKAALTALLAEEGLEARVAVDGKLTLPQERLWYLDRIEGGLPAYNLSGAFELRGDLDADRLRAALDRFVRRHQALSLAVREVAGEPRAEYGAATELHFRAVDASEALGRGWTEQALRDWLEAEAERVLPLDRAPLLRFTLIRCSDSRHVLFLLVHHLVWDGWCFDVFLREMASLYAATAPGSGAAEPAIELEPAPSFAAYAAWQRLQVSPAQLARAASYWDAALAPPLPELDLPADRGRPGMMTYAGERVPVRFEGTDLAAIRAAASAAGVTPFLFLLTAFKTLLFRCTGQTDLVVGFPVDGRSRPEFEDLVGLCVNTLVVRSAPAPDLSFSAYLGQVRDRFLEAISFQDTPFEWLVQRYAQRDPSRTPLFQAMFSHQHTAHRVRRWGPLDVRSYPRGTRSTYTDLSLWVREYEDYLDGGLDYRSDLFDRGTVEALTGVFARLVRALALDPGRRLSEPPLLDARGAAEQALGRIPEGSGTPPAEPYLARVREWRNREPAARAVGDGGSEWHTRDAVWAASGRVAGALRGKGVRPGDVVGLCTERSADLPALIVGIHRAGAVYLPLDLEYPKARLAHMLSDSGATLVIAGEAEVPLLVGVDVLDARSALAEESRAAAEEAPVGPHDLAYLMYTSGSTGQPKAVEIEHGALASFLDAMAEAIGAGPDDRWLALTTVGFDISLLELLLPLHTGAEVVVAGRDAAGDPRTLATLIERSGITSVQATPATWTTLVAERWTGRLQRIVCGGETLRRPLADRLLEHASEVWNAYGPTETTVWSAVGRVLPEGRVPVGVPLRNGWVYVLDADRRALPPGVRGEIWIGGAAVARGYRNQPALTAERFVADPFRPGYVMYRTGDLGRWRADGRLEHLGRIDLQIKLQGFRIEIGEVEAALERLGEVRQAAVELRGTDERRHLIAYVVFEPGRELLARELRQRLALTLPRFMIPGLLVPLEALPLTPNGKVDRRALPDPPATARRDRRHEPPRPGPEETVAGVWREVLATKNVGRHDNFFELGGNSLQSIRAAVEIERRAGGRVDARDFFFRTLAQLANTIEPLEGERA